MSVLTVKDLKWVQMCLFGAQLFSTCAKRQYMSIILDSEGRVTGVGYNGSAPGQPHCVDGACPRMQEGSASGSSYDNCISIHAEQNALLHSTGERYTLYVGGVPCYTCAKFVAGSGVKRVVAIWDPSYSMWKDVENLLTSSGVEVLWVARQQVSGLEVDLPNPSDDVVQ